MNNGQDIVLAFSGGLDTSFCVPWLVERGWRVTTLYVDTGGVTAARRQEIEQRAMALGAHRHLTEDASDELWRQVVIPLVMGGLAYQDQYPLLCSDRYLIAARMADVAQRIGTSAVAHGCTAMGNDQVRFDHSLRSLDDLEIIAPIREIQSETSAVRAHEIAYLKRLGFDVEARTSRYTINENLLGVTVSGAEIDEFAPPGPDTYALTAPPDRWPQTPIQATIGFERGVAVSLDQQSLSGPTLLHRLHDRFGPYGVGRGIYTGDTTVGLKGRIVYESPGLAALLTAHRALEETVLTKPQNTFKPHATREWVRLVYEGMFFEPLREDLDAFMRSTQRMVTGSVTVQTHGGTCHAISVQSPHMLCRDGAVYAQTSDWTSEEAQGFIRLIGQSTAIAARVRQKSQHNEVIACSA